MSAEPILEYLRDHPDELLATTQRLVAADTQNPPGETRLPAEWLMDELEGLGLDCERFCVDPEKPNLVATLPGEREYTLLYNGHFDTVPFDASEWSHDPLGELVDDRLYGRGATDMKGALGAMIQVARAFVRTGTRPPVTLQFAFVSDEEVTDDAGLSTRLKTNRLDPDACIIGEATGRLDVNSIAVGDRGLVWSTVRVEGEAAHGSRPMFGTNAIDWLYEYVDACRTRLAEFEVPTEPFDDRVIEESIAYYAHELSEEAATALFRHPTVNLGRIEGGEAVNSVPVRAEASLDIRFLPSVDAEDVLVELRDCTFGQEGATVGDITWREGTYTEPTTDLVQAASVAAETTFGGSRPEAVTRRRFASRGFPR